ncbi:MAG: hypothetical protein QM761_09655 [Pseudoxanthomonas sp.]
MYAKRLTLLLAALAALPIQGCAIADDETPSMRLAVVGDSDSQSYQGIAGRDGSRGGPVYHAGTLQWTEALQRLRGRQVNLGDWGRYGTPGPIARLMERFGLPARSPMKRDFRYNFAISGAVCDDLMGQQRQVPRLVRLMDQAPARWRDGVVVIRIGVNSFGQRRHLERLAEDPSDPEVLGSIDRCIAEVGRAVAYLQAHHPQVRVVLVGIFDDANVGGNIHLWQTPRQLRNIALALDRYDDALKAMAARDARVAFFNDRAWFAALWGGRAADGTPAYREVVVVGSFRVCNTQGDAPWNAVLADGHAGTAWNGLWAKALVHLLNHRFQAGITPIEQAELAPLLQAGMQSAGNAGCASG